MATKKKSRVGGARPGAGAPRIIQDPVKLTVDVERPEAEALRELAARRGQSLSKLLRTAIRAHLQRAKR